MDEKPVRLAKLLVGGAALALTVGAIYYAALKPRNYNNNAEAAAASMQQYKPVARPAMAELVRDSVSLPVFEAGKMEPIEREFGPWERVFATYSVDMNGDGKKDTFVATRKPYFGKSLRPLDEISLHVIEGDQSKFLGKYDLPREFTNDKIDRFEFVDFDSDGAADIIHKIDEARGTANYFVKAEPFQVQKCGDCPYGDLDHNGMIDIFTTDSESLNVKTWDANRFEERSYPLKDALTSMLRNINRNVEIIQNSQDKQRLTAEFTEMYPPEIVNLYFQTLTASMGYTDKDPMISETSRKIEQVMNSDGNAQKQINDIFNSIPPEYRPLVALHGDVSSQDISRLEAYQAAAAELTKPPALILLSALARGTSQALGEYASQQEEQQLRKAYGMGPNDKFSNPWHDQYKMQTIMRGPSEPISSSNDHYIVDRQTESNRAGTSVRERYAATPQQAEQRRQQEREKNDPVLSGIREAQKGADAAGKAVGDILKGIIPPPRK